MTEQDANSQEPDPQWISRARALLALAALGAAAILVLFPGSVAESRLAPDCATSVEAAFTDLAHHPSRASLWPRMVEAEQACAAGRERDALAIIAELVPQAGPSPGMGTAMTDKARR